MKIFINENQLKTLKETNYNFHYGKEHNLKPYYSENKYVCYHETGQFGSGTYFSTYNSPYEKKDALEKYGENHKNQDPNFIQIGDNVYRVDFDLYKNLYKVYSENQGNVLHTMMGDLNRFYHKISGFGLGHYQPKMADFDNSNIYQRIEMNAHALGLKCPSYMKLTRMAQEHAKSDAIQSFATLFMEKNGFNGVNVSGINKFDNSRHGSVIYDLSKMSNELTPVSKSILYNPSTVGSSHQNSIAYEWLGDGNYSKEKAESLNGKLNFFKFNKLNDKERFRLIKNVLNSPNPQIDTRQLRYYLEDYPHIENYLFKQMFNGKVDEDIVMDYDMMDYIVSKNKTYFINYSPKRYNNQRYSFLEEFLDKYDDDNWNATKEEKEQYLNSLLQQLNRPLTDNEKTYIQSYIEEE